MKCVTILLAWTITTLGIHTKPIPGGEEIDSHASAFHHAIHNSAEFYLVCLYDVHKKPWNKDWEQLEIKATIVLPIKGRKPMGEKISFERVLDGKYGDISHMDGSLYFVRYDKVEGAASGEPRKLGIDAQDPHAVFRSSEDLFRVALEHKETEWTGGAERAKPSR
jgi:hypothetical protein